MPSNWCRLVALVFAVGLVACHSQTAKAPPASPPPPAALRLPPAAETAAAALYAQSRAAGMVVAVVQGDAAAVRGFGRLGPADPRVPDGATLVRLDSISKLFTAELLAKLAVEHKLGLTDPLTRFAPPGWQPGARPAKDPPPITLIQLATHTGGLPRVYPLGVYAAPPSPEQARADRWTWLASRRNARDPGKGAHYSNLGFNFLGDALGVAAGSDFPTALKLEVTDPLGMADTTASPSSEACARMMAGDPARNPPPCTDTSYQAASGGLYSTPNDMARWMENQLGAGAPDPVRKVSQTIYVRRDQLAYASGLDIAGPANGVGLAWIELAPDGGHPRLIEKTGGGYGFMTYLVLDPEHRIGVFLAMNKMSGAALKRAAQSANDLVATLAGFNPALAGPEPATNEPEDPE